MFHVDLPADATTAVYPLLILTTSYFCAKKKVENLLIMVMIIDNG